jgi:hypothetical protein
MYMTLFYSMLICLILFGILYYSIKIKTPHELFWHHHYDISYPEPSYEEEYVTPIIILVPLYNSNVSLFRKRIDYLMRHVRDWRIYIYGLDSTRQETLDALNLWKHENPHVHLVSPLSELPKNRTQRIGAIRNALLDAVPPSSESSMVLVYDGDHRGPMSKKGLFHTLDDLSRHPEWFAISSSGGISILPGIHIIYDPFAYRSIENKSDIPRCHWLLSDYKVVKSAFSGACVYRWSELKQFRYPLVENVCEHVSLHIQMGEQLGKSMVMSKAFHILVGHQASVL